MALVIKDRVRQTSTTAGTGTITLSGSVTGFQDFTVIGTGNTTYYTIADQSGANWEVGLGTYTSPNQLSRDKILESSNSNNAVIFGSGIKDVFLSYPAEASCNGISVKSYGAKGDGTTDDTVAIQNCITQNPNRKIFFPKGKYRITNTITINPLYGYILEGDGYDPMSPDYPAGGDNQFTNIWMDDRTGLNAFEIIWDYSTYPRPAFREVLFRNLTVSGTPCTYANNTGNGNGIYVDYVVLRLENVCLGYHGKNGLYLAQGFSSVFTACLFNYNTENGVYMPGNNNQVGFTGCQFLGNSRVDNFTDPNGDSVGAAGVMIDGSYGTNLTVTFTNCEFSINGLNDRVGETTQVAAAHGLYARNTTGLSLIGCYAEYNYGQYATNGSGMYLSDNINIDSSCSGVYITGLFSQTSDINIINCVGLIIENGTNYDTAFTITENPSSSPVSRSPIIRLSADTSNQSFFRVYGNTWGANTTTTFTNTKQVDQFYSATDPTGTGTHKIGDICWSTGTLTGTNPIGWICTTAPNTFKAFGGSSGTVTQINTSGSVSGITLTGGPITSTGTIILGGTLDLSAPPAIGATTPNTGAFTTITASSNATLTAISDPSAPSNGNVAVYAKTFGGYPTLAARNALNKSFGLQSALWSKNITMWTNTNSTAGSWLNSSGASSGTFTAVTPTVGSTLYQTIRRSTYANVITTTNQVLGVNSSYLNFFRGSVAGQGGFFFYARCGFDVWTNGGRFFAGLTVNNTTIVNTDPSGNNNTVGFCVDAADNGAISFLTRGTAATKASTGYTITSNKGYELYIYCSPNSSQYTWQIVDINAGTSASGTATLNLPTNTQTQQPTVLASNAALTTATAISLGISKIYCESDY